jgi:signal transduction histidine kinase
MHSKVIFFCFAFFLLATTSLHAQKKYPGTDSVSITALLKRTEDLTKAASYDSAIAVANQALMLSKKNASKKSEVEVYEKLSEIMLLNGRMAELRHYDSLILPMATQLKDTSLMVNSYNRLGVYLMEQGKNKDAEKYLQTALTLRLEKEQSKKTAEVYSNLASVYLANGDRDKASEWFFKALRLYEKNNSETGQGETYSNISSVLFLSGRHDEAISYLKKSIALREKLNDKQGLAISYSNIAQMYILKDSLGKALQYQQQAVQKAEQINNPKLIAASYTGMAAVYNRQKNFAEALVWQTKAIKIFEAADNKPALSRLYVAAGNLSNAVGDSVAAINYYNKALALAKQLGNKDNISNAYDKLSSFYQSHNDEKNAYLNYKLFIGYRDSIAANSTVAKLEEVKTKYETEKKDAEIDKLNNEKKIQQLELEKQDALIHGNVLAAKQKQNEIDLLSKENELRDVRLKQQGEQLEKQLLIAQNNEQQLKLAEQAKQLQEKQLQNQKQFRNVMFAGIGVLLILGFFLFNRYQLKRKLQQQEELLNIRNNISRNLHDDIGASLSNIGILNELAKRNADNKEKANAYLSKAGEDIQSISESLSDIVWNINPKYDELENLFIRMKRYGADMLDGKNIKGDFIFPEDAEAKLNMEQRRDLYLIYKEAINNLVKYSGATEASIKIATSKNKLTMLINDNGKGFELEKVNTGNGLTNMKQRAAAFNGELNINSAVNKGTTIALEMLLS